MQKIAFIDLEASGLGPNSWPIEVGWGYPGAAPAACLIKPDEAWTLDAWSQEAEALHGITSTELIKAGESAPIVCKQLNAALKGCLVYSNAPDWDGFWLYRLFSAGKLKQEFDLLDFRLAFDALGVALTPAMFDEANKIAPHIHRAAADVSHMQAVYRLAQRAQK